jgi:methyltransferase (TIGR00027 family)
VRTSVVARTRLIDEAITASVDDKVTQVVILGAGFDSRAYRLPALRRALVFEVDHPDTQRAKRKVLDRAWHESRGLALERDVGAAEYRRRAFGEASRRMRGHEFYRVALARVA